MSRRKTLQEMFKRYRRPGDIVFAAVFFALSAFLLSQTGTQSPWKGTNNVFSQPAFWPTVSLSLMTVFAGLHLLSSGLSPRIEGRWTEVWQWVKGFEFAGWFLAYVWIVPILGYLPTTIVAAAFLGVRMGYRRPVHLGALVATGIAIVVIFRGLLQVRIPAGQAYDYLPDPVRILFLTYL